MASIFDVATYIIENLGPTNAKKLHKLAYYAQGWSLAWTGSPLFASRIEAWRDGPVVRDLYQKHRQSRVVSNLPGAAQNLTATERGTLDSVLAFYGHRDAQWLIDRTHAEAPWIEARRGLQWWQSGDREITLESMAKFFKSIDRV